MSERSARAQACANIAFIKYWGNRDDRLRLPANSSLSMNLDGLYADTTVTWRSDLNADRLVLNDEPATGAALARVSQQLQRLRERLQISQYAEVISRNNFPTGAGIASSAAAFAALTVAGVSATGVEISERELTTLARLGSGSASGQCRVALCSGRRQTRGDSFAESIAAPDHWSLVDLIAVVSAEHKPVGSTEGHTSASTSDLQAARVSGAEERLRVCRQALLERDFPTFANVVEHDSNLMHAVMMTSRPPLFYWQPATLTVMAAVRQWRAEGLRVCYTLDAGPNVHCLCLSEDADEVRARLQTVSGIMRLYEAAPGGPANILPRNSTAHESST